MSRVLAILSAALFAMACSGPRALVAMELWPPPAGARPALAAVPPGHLLAPVIAAFEAGDCESGVVASRALMGVVEAQVATAFHPLDGAEEGTGTSLAAATMRELLDEYVYVVPPVLTIGDQRFTYPTWWSDDYGYCLTVLGRYSEAAEVYILRLQDEVEAEALWHLALAYAWDERPREALDVLEAWPDGLEQPSLLPDVVAHLREGRSVPRRLEAGGAP